MERKLLSALLRDRQVWEGLKPVVDPKTDFSEHGKLIWEQVVRQYSLDPNVSQIDADLLKGHFQMAHPKHAEIFIKIIDDLPEVSIPNVVDFFIEYKKERLGTQLAESLINPKSKDTPKLIEQYSYCEERVRGKLEKESEEAVDIEDLEGLTKEFKQENLIKLYPLPLSEAIGGGVTKGTHILIYGTPDSGKTAFAISVAAGFLKEGKKVLYIGNEDSKRLIVMRFYNRMSGMDRMQVLAGIDDAKRKAYGNGLGNLIFVPRSPGHISDVERLIEKHKPDCVVIDQLHNLRYYGNLSKVEKLEALTYEVRNFTKAADIVTVSLTQAADSAYGKLVLEMEDVFFSNIGIQANVDIMLGLGWDTNYQALGKRMISVTKNKMNEFHGPIPVNFNPMLSKIY